MGAISRVQAESRGCSEVVHGDMQSRDVSPGCGLGYSHRGIRLDGPGAHFGKAMDKDTSHLVAVLTPRHWCK